MTSKCPSFENVKQQRAGLYTTIFSQVFSPCGSFLVASNNFGRLAIFSVTSALAIDAVEDTRLPVNQFQAHNGSIYVLASTPDFLISGGSSEIHGWKWKDVIHCKDPRPSWTLNPPASSPFDIPETNGLAYNSQNSTLISGGGDNKLYVWDLETGQCKATLTGHKDYIHCVAALEKSNRCVSGSEDGTVRFWDCRVKQSMQSMIEPNKEDAAKRPDVGSWISCVVTDDAEQWLVCGGGPYLTCWHIASSTLTTALPTANSCPLTAVYHEDKILSGGTEPKLFHWSLNGEKQAEIPVSPRAIYSLAVNENSQSNKVLAISGESTNIDVCTNFNYQAFSFQFKS